MTPPSDLRCHAMNRPTEIPMRYSTTKAPPNRNRVLGKASAKTCDTGAPSEKERPKLNVNMFPRKIQSCTYHG